MEDRIDYEQKVNPAPLFSNENYRGSKIVTPTKDIQKIKLVKSGAE